MKKLLFLFAILFSFYQINAQPSVGIGTTAPHGSTQLHVASTSKGLLIPQVSIDSLRDVTSISLPANGLIVYNTTEPGVRNDMARGYYWYSTSALTWVRFADNLNDNVWQNGGALGIQLRDKNDGVEILDEFAGSAVNYNPKLKILNVIDSALLNTKNNIPVLTLTGVNRKTAAGWENRQKTSIIFENVYQVGTTTTTGTVSTAISSYTENSGTSTNTQTNGLAFYVTATPHNAAVSDTPSMAMYRHNVGIGAYPTDISQVTEGRLQITGFSNGDQLSLRHPVNVNLKWGLYVSQMDSSLNFYNNGSLRSKIDRETGVYTALSDRNRKKNIQPLSPVLSSIMQLPVYSYNYLDSKDDGRRMIGLMAQDVQPYFPELVYQGYDREITKPVLSMDYAGMGVIAIKGIQEQQFIISQLQKENNSLQSQISQLLERIQKLEAKQ